MGRLFEEGNETAAVGVEPTRSVGKKNRSVRYEQHEANQEKGKHSTITTTSLRALLERQGYRCALTGEAMTPEDCSLDHKIPLSRGGPHSIDNVQFITNSVNKLKAEMTDAEFIAVCEAVVRHAKGGGGLLGPSA